MDDERAKRVSLLAAQTLHKLKDMAIADMQATEDSDAMLTVDTHLAYSIAIEAVRKAFVLQYDERWKEVIFSAAERLHPAETTSRPTNKA
jgi:hypothetical protein